MQHTCLDQREVNNIHCKESDCGLRSALGGLFSGAFRGIKRTKCLQQQGGEVGLEEKKGWGSCSCWLSDGHTTLHRLLRVRASRGLC